MSSPYNVSPFNPEVIRVQRYSQARALAKDCLARPRSDDTPGSIVVSMAGGKKRWATFQEAGGHVTVTLMGTVIMRFFPLWVEFQMAGFNSVTTRSAVNNLLSGGMVTASDKDPITGESKRMFYTPPGASDAIEVPSHALRVRYSGTVINAEDFAKLQERQKAADAKKSARPKSTRRPKKVTEEGSVAA